MMMAFPVAFIDTCNHDATILMQAAAQLPGSLRSLHVFDPREVVLHVYLDDRGQVREVRMLSSARNRDLDNAAVRAAQASRYSPRMQDCKPDEGDLLFRVIYDPHQQ